MMFELKFKVRCGNVSCACMDWSINSLEGTAMLAVTLFYGTGILLFENLSLKVACLDAPPTTGGSIIHGNNG